MTTELKQRDMGLLVKLLTSEMDRVGEAKRKNGFRDLAYFYHLVDMRNKVLTMSVAGELQTGVGGKGWEIAEISKKRNKVA